MLRRLLGGAALAAGLLTCSGAQAEWSFEQGGTISSLIGFTDGLDATVSLICFAEAQAAAMGGTKYAIFVDHPEIEPGRGVDVTIEVDGRPVASLFGDKTTRTVTVSEDQDAIAVAFSAIRDASSGVRVSLRNTREKVDIELSLSTDGLSAAYQEFNDACE